MKIKKTFGAGSKAPRTSFASLPDEITLRVIKEAGLFPLETIKLQGVNKQFNRICRSNELWKHLIVPRQQQQPTRKDYMQNEPPLFDDLCKMPADELDCLKRIWRESKFGLFKVAGQDRESGLGYRTLQSIVRQFPKSRQINYSALQLNGSVIFQSAPEIQRSVEFILAAAESRPYVLLFVAPQLLCDKEFIHAAVERNRQAIKYADQKLLGDKEFILSVLKHSPVLLDCVVPRLRADREVVFAAIKQDDWVFQYLNPEQLGDKEIVLALVKKRGWSLMNVNAKMRGDKDVVLAAVKKTPWALQFADANLRNDKEVVRQAVKNDRSALQFASLRLRLNPAMWF